MVGRSYAPRFLSILNPLICSLCEGLRPDSSRNTSRIVAEQIVGGVYYWITSKAAIASLMMRSTEPETPSRVAEMTTVPGRSATTAPLLTVATCKSLLAHAAVKDRP